MKPQATLGLALPFLLAAGPTAAPRPELHLPIACAVGKTCFIQQYFDHDPGPGAKDYRCGGRVYDGHDGVDIRLPSLAAQKRGVAVLAAADGTVLGLRDGVDDHLVENDADRATIKGRECGNGVLIGHAGGWQTQYCHMARGSVVVAKGQAVKAGDKLGLVGLSGDTQFPHVHLSVREGARKVDPFLPDAPPGACAPKGGRTLWAPEAAAALAYRSTEIINTGFADGPVTMDALEAASLAVPGRDSPALVFYGRAIGLQKGDSIALTVKDPSGTPIVSSSQTADRAKAQYMIFSGKKRPAIGWDKGRYTAEVVVTRGGAVVASRTDGLMM